MPKWDYQILNVGDQTDWMKLRDTFIGLGKEEWELVAVAMDLHAKGRALYIFKKPLEE